METISVFGHSIVLIRLSARDIAGADRLCVERTALNESELGWKYRHAGMKSETAHALGTLGEIAVERWLDNAGIVYEAAPDS